MCVYIYIYIYLERERSERRDNRRIFLRWLSSLRSLYQTMYLDI